MCSSGSSTSSGCAPLQRAGPLGEAGEASSSATAAAVACSAGKLRDQLRQHRLVEFLSRASARSRAPSTLSSKRLQLGGDEALGGFHGLAAQIVRRARVGMRARTLDEEALHAVEAQLQSRDAGAFALALFQFQQERSVLVAMCRSSSSCAS